MSNRNIQSRNIICHILALLLFIFLLNSSQAAQLGVIPEKVLVQQKSFAKFTIITESKHNITDKDIIIEGLPEHFTYSVNCTGMKGSNCKGKTGENDLPVFTLNIKVPDSQKEGSYSFSVSTKKLLGYHVPLTIDVNNSINFIHPGIMLNTSMLAQMKSHVHSANAAWDKAYNNVLNSQFANRKYSPSPHSRVDAGDKSADDLRRDAIAAYTQALLWIITEHTEYADNAIDIMNSWSSAQSDNFTGSNKYNLAAWVGDVWPRAAEIIRYTYKDAAGNAIWQPKEVERFKNMLQVRYATFISAGFPASGQYGGNLIASQAAALIHIGVFNDDEKTYISGIEKWRRMLPAYIYMKKDGAIPAPPAFWKESYISKDNLLKSYWYNQDLSADVIGDGGFTEETCRDLGHVLWGISALANGAQTARIQGLDLNREATLNTPNTLRLSQGLEFNIGYLNSSSSPSIPAPQDLCNGSLKAGSSTGQGELLFNDLVTRRGLSLAQTAQYLNAHRPGGASYFMNWETLTHYLNP